MGEKYERTEENIRLEKALAEAIVENGQPNEEVAAILAHAHMKRKPLVRVAVKRALDEGITEDLDSTARQIVEGFSNAASARPYNQGSLFADSAVSILVQQHDLDRDVARALSYTLTLEDRDKRPSEVARTMLETHTKLFPRHETRRM